jgi:hypothetical protein
VIGDRLANRLARRRKWPGVVDQPLEENAARIACFCSRRGQRASAGAGSSQRLDGASGLIALGVTLLLPLRLGSLAPGTGPG